jgi:hypothetical protein
VYSACERLSTTFRISRHDARRIGGPQHKALLGGHDQRIGDPEAREVPGDDVYEEIGKHYLEWMCYINVMYILKS